MRRLIDTQVLLWLLTGSLRLPPDLTVQLADRRNDVFVSAVSGWEIAIKVGLGKLTVPPNLQAWLPDEIVTAGLTVLPVQLVHALAVEHLPRHHADPFDRLLIAQAQLAGLTLVSSDHIFTRYDVPLISC